MGISTPAAVVLPTRPARRSLACRPRCGSPAALIAILLALALAACGGDDDTGGEDDSPDAAAEAPASNVLHSNGEEFDASWDRGEPFAFELGAGQVIPGWDEGVVGMKAGGRRQLVIPPDQAYGSAGAGPIGPDETLVFVVDLVNIR